MNFKMAFVAEVDGEIVGGISYRFINTNGNKTGYIDYVFVLPSYQGKGVGSKLYRKTIEYLWEQGCDFLSALVKDDNVASWSLFLKNGFHRCNIIDATNKFGIVGLFKHYFQTPWFVGIGMDYYVAIKPLTEQVKSSKTSTNITTFLLFNMIALLISILIHSTHSVEFALAYILVLTTLVLTGYVGTRLTKRKWTFRFTDGGLIFTVLNSLTGGLFPAIGNWYPKQYENTTTFKKDMAMVSSVSWLATIILVLLPTVLVSDNYFIISTSEISKIFLIIKIITIYPASAFGAMRVYDWNKYIWGVFLIASILVMWV